MGGNNTHSLSMVIKTVLGSSIQSVINSDTERNPKAKSIQRPCIYDGPFNLLEIVQKDIHFGHHDM